MQATLTLIGLHNYMYDADDNPDGLFTNLTVPEDTIDRATLINTILMRGQEFEVLYPDPDVMSYFIGVWSQKWADTITRWYNAFHKEYDPIENYDRQEDWTDTGEGSGTAHGESSGGGTNTHEVSAFDAPAATPYSPESKDTTTDGTKTDTASLYSNENVHTGRVHGNIGVTTSQQMIHAEYELYLLNLYDEIADLFLKEFVIPVN